MNWLWSVRTIDVVIILSVIAFLCVSTYVILVERRKSKPKNWKDRRERTISIFGLLMIVVGAYVAYGSFRNQLRITAENALNEEGSALFDIEMEGDSDLRCIYDNYGHFAPDGCLLKIVSDEKLWSRAIFYVEESWFILEKAHQDRAQWGSDYARVLEYWAQDVSRDPTGLFSYYLVSSNDTVSEARGEMEASGVCIPDLCKGYQKVREALPDEAKDRQRAVVCLSDTDLTEARSACKQPR